MYKLMQLIIILRLTAAAVSELMEVKYSWKYVDYKFDKLEDRQAAVDSKHFIPENCVVLDVDVFQCKQYYII